MLSSLARHLFGLADTWDEETCEDVFEETSVNSTIDSEDWILIEPRQKVKSNATVNTAAASTSTVVIGSSEQSTDCFGFDGDVGLVCPRGTGSGKIVRFDNGEDKENKESVDGDSPGDSVSNPDSNLDSDFDSGSFTDSIDSWLENIKGNCDKKTATPKKSKKETHYDDDGNNHTGIMEGSWFVTPPPCFVSHKKVTTEIPASPFEDMLIEHPSISVYQSYTSTFDLLLDSVDFFLTQPFYKKLSWPDWKMQQKILPAQSMRMPGYKSNGSSSRSSFVNRNGNYGASSSSNRYNSNNDNNNPNSNNSNRLGAVTQPQAVRGADVRAINNDNHDRNGYLGETTNHHLASMQKAIKNGSQKKLKKSFLNRQNKVRSDRHRSNQRPNGRSYNLKIC